MIGDVFTEWRNNAEEINYPFSDLATLRNADNVTIDRDIFVDARIYPIGATENMFLQEIEVTDTRLIFKIGDPVLGILATGGYDLAGPIPNEIALFDQYDRPAGILVSEQVRLIALPAFYGKGVFRFTVAQTPFAPSVIVPTPQPGVRGFLLDDGAVVAGDVYLLGTDGIVVRFDTDGTIRVDVIGDPYARLQACREEGFVVEPFCGIKTINLIPPDENGNFVLTPGANIAPDNVVRVEFDGSIFRVRRVGAVGVET